MKNLKETILELVKKVDDSKEALELAEEQLFSIAEEIAETFYLAARDYGNSSKFFGDEYRVNRGGLVKFKGIVDDTLVFIYNDYCYGEDHYAHVNIPLAWFEDGALESYKKECKMRKTESLKYKIAQHQKSIERLEKESNNLK